MDLFITLVSKILPVFAFFVASELRVFYFFLPSSVCIFFLHKTQSKRKSKETPSRASWFSFFTSSTFFAWYFFRDESLYSPTYFLFREMHKCIMGLGHFHGHFAYSTKGNSHPFFLINNRKRLKQSTRNLTLPLSTALHQARPNLLCRALAKAPRPL